MKYLGQERKRRRLNEDAIPSKFTGVPAYLSKQRPKKRSVSALSSERQRNEAVKAEEAGKAFLDTDKITTFEDIILNSPELPLSVGNLKKNLFLKRSFSMKRVDQSWGTASQFLNPLAST